MRFRLTLSLFFAFSLLPYAAKAEPIVTSLSGTNLYDDCATKADDPNALVRATLCMGYISAITDSLSFGNSINGLRACIPAGVDMNQIVDISKAAIKSQPERRHLVASILLAEALSRSFPCRKTAH
jgi:hypothetical protein